MRRLLLCMAMVLANLVACSSAPPIGRRLTAPKPTVVAVQMVKGLPVTTAQIRDKSGAMRPVRLDLLDRSGVDAGAVCAAGCGPDIGGRAAFDAQTDRRWGALL